MPWVISIDIDADKTAAPADQRTCLELLRLEGYERVAWERASGLRAEGALYRPPLRKVS